MIWLLLAPALAQSPCDALDQALSDPAGQRCSTVQLHAARTSCPDVLAAHGLPVVAPRAPSPAPAPPGSKITRDAAGSWTNVVETDNFAIKWGDDTTVNVSDIQRIADRFEAVWQKEVVEWGYPAPEQSSTYRFNVYIGDTGSPSPTAAGYGGYFWYDSEGYPEIVLERLALTDTVWADDLASHEFFHAVQGASNTYVYEGSSAWYSEATATWAETEFSGATATQAVNLPGVALLPDLNIGHFGDIDNDAWSDYHPYGAFVFISYISQIAGSHDTILRSYTEAPYGSDPLLILDELLAEDGSSIEAAHQDFAGRLATWDFPDSAVYQEAFDPWADDLEGHRIEDTLVYGGEPIVARPAFPPESFGVNLWELTAPIDVTITFTPQSTPEHWSFALSAMQDGVGVQIPLPTDGTTFETQGIADLTDVHLVVSAQDATDDYTTTHNYVFVVAGIEPDVAEPEPRACGCASSSISMLWFWVPMALLRRRTSP